MYKIKLFFGLLGLGLIVGCSEKTTTSNVENSVKAFVDPPIQELQMPFEAYQVDANSGDTLVYPSGTVIVFPKNAFTDSNGNVVEGPVEVKYREFKDAVDFYLSGIPMNYTPPGSDKEAVFESAGMCELVAYRGDELLRVNQSSMPELHMTTSSDSPDFNLYYLDTISKKWIEKGKDEIVDLNEFENDSEEEFLSEIVSKTAMVPEALPMIEPRRANPDMPKFEIEIDPSALPELRAYNGMFFELHESEKKYNIDDANEDYENLKIERGEFAGTYEVSFSRVGKEVSYLTRPVLEGKDYDEALKVFKSKQKEFEIAQDRRVKDEKQKEKEAILAQRKLVKEREEAQVKAEREAQQEARAELKAESDRKKEELKWNRQQEEMNRMREKEVRAENREIEKQRDAMILAARKNAQREEQLAQSTKQNFSDTYGGGLSMYGSVIRSFAIDGFGVWNSDAPIYFLERGAISVIASFEDEEGNPLNFEMVQTVFTGFNAVSCDHNPGIANSFPRFMVMPDCRQIIWAIKGNELYYIKESDKSKIKLDPSSKKGVFTMQKHLGEIKKVEEVKKILGISENKLVAGL